MGGSAIHWECVAEPPIPQLAYGMKVAEWVVPQYI